MTEERMHELLDIAMRFDGIETVRKRLAGVSPSVDQPGLVEELADNKGATTDQGHSRIIGETKVRLELKRLRDRLFDEAAGHEGALEFESFKKFPELKKEIQEKAADCDLWVSILDAFLEAEPSPQSVTGDVEECPECKSTDVWHGASGRPICGLCGFSWGHGGDDGSGACLPNADCDTPP